MCVCVCERKGASECENPNLLLQYVELDQLSEPHALPLQLHVGGSKTPALKSIETCRKFELLRSFDKTVERGVTYNIFVM